MADIRNPKLLWFKGLLFVFLAVLAGGLLLVENPAPRTWLLLLLTVWASCRAYYFAFYVIEHYIDPRFRFAGLWSVARYLLGRPGPPGDND